MSIPLSSKQSRIPTVEIDFGSAYELLMSLLVFNEHEGFDYEVGKEWFEAVRSKATPALLQDIQQFSPSWQHVWIQLFGLVYDSSSPRDVPAFLEHLEAVEPLELRLHLLGFYQKRFRRRIPLDVILQAAEGDLEAQQQFLRVPLFENPDWCNDWQEAARQLFSLDLETTKTTLLSILQSWYDQVFRDQEQQVLPILERDAGAKQALKSTLTSEQLIEAATNGLEYEPEAGLRRILLIPSFIHRPWNITSEYQDMKIFCYPVADESVEKDSSIPPVRLVRLYKALADERRLRILKMLTTRSYSLQEMADEFGVAKTTMHHHLATLRAAGLVLAHPDDKDYTLRRNMLSEVSELLDAYLADKS
jgi:DNA-binding transcriptional ArsR family regulator